MEKPVIKLIVLSGCSGGGKSTLLEMMAGRGYIVYPEPGRQIVQEQLKLGEDGVPWKDPKKFCELCIERYIEYHQSAHAQEGTAILDRSLIDAISAAEHYQFKTSQSTNQLAKEYSYSSTVYFTPPWEEIFVNDSERKHSFKDALEEYERLNVSYQKYGYHIVELPKFSPGERADYLESSLKNNPGAYYTT